MPPAGIQRILTTASLIEQYKVAPEKRIAGDPCQGLVNVFSDPGGEFHVGIWEGEMRSGEWPTVKRNTAKFSQAQFE